MIFIVCIYVDILLFRLDIASLHSCRKARILNKAYSCPVCLWGGGRSKKYSYLTVLHQTLLKLTFRIINKPTASQKQV